MNTKSEWKQHNRRDSTLNALLIVLALGVLGASAVEEKLDPEHPAITVSASAPVPAMNHG